MGWLSKLFENWDKTYETPKLKPKPKKKYEIKEEEIELVLKNTIIKFKYYKKDDPTLYEKEFSKLAIGWEGYYDLKGQDEITIDEFREHFPDWFKKYLETRSFFGTFEKSHLGDGSTLVETERVYNFDEDVRVTERMENEFYAVEYYHEMTEKFVSPTKISRLVKSYHVEWEHVEHFFLNTPENRKKLEDNQYEVIKEDD